MNKLIVIIVSMAFLSCSNMKESQIEDLVCSGVVLIQNTSYYELIMSNGTSIFFSSYDEENGVIGLQTDRDSVEMAKSYGTGFIVSPKGHIATNAHVVSNMVSEKDVNKSMSKLFTVLKDVYKEVLRDYKMEKDTVDLLYNIANISDEISYDTFYKIRDYREDLNENIEECEEVISALNDIRISDSELKYHNEVSIAYNDTYVTSMNDFSSCVITATDMEHDVAILQLKDKCTPKDKYVFSIPEEDPLESYSFFDNLTTFFDKDKNSRLFMPSFNLGPALALTDEGVMCQFNSGSISQKTKDKIMYSIPTLNGSSGSPVVNLKGEIVAINNSGINNTQSFNFGVRIKHLRNLINE